MAQNAVIRARIDQETKDEATKILAEIGLTTSDVCRMAIKAVVRERKLPFKTERVPNDLTVQTLEKTDRGEDLYRAKDVEDLFRQLGI